MEADDVDILLELTSGPALALNQRTQHFAAATGETDLFPNTHWKAGKVTLTDDDIAVVDGAIVWGGDEAIAREATQFEFRHDGQRWLLDNFLRNGIPIGQWVTPGSDTRVHSGPVTVELVSTFTDLTCMPGVESACPDFLRNSTSLDLLVENRSGGDLQPGSLTLPDGALSPAWLETPSGDAYPLLDAVVAGFPPTTTVPVIGLFAAADDLAEGGVLYLVYAPPTEPTIPSTCPSHRTPTTGPSTRTPATDEFAQCGGSRGRRARRLPRGDSRHRCGSRVVPATQLPRPMSTIELESRSRPISRKEASHDHETIDHLASVSAVALAVLCPASGEGGDDAITTSVADAWQPDHCGDQQRRSRPTLGRRSTPGSPSNFHDTATEFTQLGIHRKEKQVNKTNGATAATAAANEPSTGEPGQDDPTEHSWVFCG